MPETTPSFNLAEVIDALRRRWKTIAVFIIISLVIAALLLFFVIPKSYRSVAVVVAANPALADKARLSNPNIEALYSSFGSGDDLDRIYGIAQLDTTYKLLVDEFDLVKYYKINEGDRALDRSRAVHKLKDNLLLQKTELLQLKIIGWTKDKQLSANLANRMVANIQMIGEGIWQQSYKNSYEKTMVSITFLNKEIEAIADSLRVMDVTATNAMLMNNKQSVLMEQIKLYQKLANEFKMAMDNKAPALIVLENAYPSARPGKPKKIRVLFATLLISFGFAVLAVLLYDRNKAG